MDDLRAFLSRVIDRAKDEPVLAYGLIAAALIYFDVDPSALGEASEEIEALVGLGLAGIVRALVSPVRRVLTGKKGHPEADEESGQEE